MQADRSGPRLPSAVLYTVGALGNWWYATASSPLQVVLARGVVGVGSAVLAANSGCVSREAALPASATRAERDAATRTRDARLGVLNASMLLGVMAGPALAACFATLPVVEKTRTGRLTLTRYNAPGYVLASTAGVG